MAWYSSLPFLPSPGLLARSSFPLSLSLGLHLPDRPLPAPGPSPFPPLFPLSLPTSVLTPVLQSPTAARPIDYLKKFGANSRTAAAATSYHPQALRDP